ncbi:MAG: hypothetical protein JWP63_6953 [Candidatus Solibacter sp.]|jgi:hypothetical protein|nr:hypothetical protein [Candidatus Solibacter sp.]
MRKLLLLSSLALGVACAQDRPALNGVWQLDAARSSSSDPKFKSLTLSIKQEDESIKIAETAEENGKEKKFEYECNTNGKECSLKVNGQPLKYSAYYNADVLIVIEQRKGNDSTIRKRFKTSEDGASLTIEVSNLARPGQKADTLVYKKQTAAH